MVISQQFAGEYEAFSVVPDQESAGSRFMSTPFVPPAPLESLRQVLFFKAVLVRGLGFGTLTNGIALVFKSTCVVSQTS